MRLITPVILCGGAGTRLWPASREEKPKPFLPLLDGISTFAATLARVADPATYAAPFVVANHVHRFLVAEAVRESGLPATILLEPAGRDSGPAIAAALALAASSDPEALVLVLAADHLIRDVAGFAATARLALPAAEGGGIVVFGIKPTEPATGFGYIRPTGAEFAPGIRKVGAFVEKPDLTTAGRYLAEGYLWNAGMFMMRAREGLGELRRLAAGLAEAAEASIAEARADADFVRLSDRFLTAPKISFDYAVMEKTDRAAVVTAGFDWSDIGSWSALWETSPRDGDGNAASGFAVLHEARNCFVRTDGEVVALAGVDDLVVIVEGGSVLVASRHKPDLVKVVVDKVKAGKG